MDKEISPQNEDKILDLNLLRQQLTRYGVDEYVIERAIEGSKLEYNRETHYPTKE